MTSKISQAGILRGAIKYLFHFLPVIWSCLPSSPKPWLLTRDPQGLASMVQSSWNRPMLQDSLQRQCRLSQQSPRPLLHWRRSKSLCSNCVYLWRRRLRVQRCKLPVRRFREKEIWLITRVLSAVQNTCSINPSCQYFASYALDIVNDCSSNGALYYLAGQEFDTDDYNVIVSAQNC